MKGKYYFANLFGENIGLSLDAGWGAKQTQSPRLEVGEGRLILSGSETAVSAPARGRKVPPSLLEGTPGLRWPVPTSAPA